MSCDPPTSITTLTRLSTVYADVLTTLTSLEPVPWAARTSDGVVRTPVRTVTAVRYVEVTSVVERLEERTVVGVCTPTPTPTPEPTSAAEVSAVRSATTEEEEEAIPSSSAVPSTIVPPSVARQSESSSTAPTPPPLSTSSRTTYTLTRTTEHTASPSSRDVVRPFSVPAPSSSSGLGTTSLLAHFPTVSISISSSAPTASHTLYDNTTGLFSSGADIVEDRPLSQGAIGGLAVGGLAALALILFAVWWAQHRSRSAEGSEGDGDREGRKGSWPWIERLSGGQVPREGSAKRNEELEEKDYSYLPHPYPNPTSSSSTLPSTSTSSISKSDIRVSRSTAPPTPINPYPSTRPYSSSPATQLSTRTAIVSPTPAIVDRERAQTRLGSMWSRMSGLGWQMGLWGGESGPAIDFSAPQRDPPSGSREKDNAGLVDLLSASEGEGRIPSMLDLRTFGRTLSVIEDHGPARGLKPKASQSTLAGSDRLSVPSHAPARPSSEYTRGEDEVDALFSAGLSPLAPPVPIRVDAVGMATFPVGGGVGKRGKDDKRVSPLTKKRRSSAAVEVGMAGMTSPIRAGVGAGAGARVLAGHKRLSGSSLPPSTAKTPSPRTPSKAPPPRPTKSTSRPPLIYPQPHSRPSPGSSRTPSPPSRAKRVPPTLQFAKEVSMAHLWMDNGANIAVFNPDSATRPLPPRGAATLSAGPMLSAFGIEQPDVGRSRRGSVSSAYDGMTEVDVTPLAPRLGQGAGGGMGSEGGAGSGRGVKPGEIFDYAQLGSARSSSLGALGSGRLASGMGKRPVVLPGGKGMSGGERGEMGVV